MTSQLGCDVTQRQAKIQNGNHHMAGNTIASTYYYYYFGVIVNFLPKILTEFEISP